MAASTDGSVFARLARRAARLTCGHRTDVGFGGDHSRIGSWRGGPLLVLLVLFFLGLGATASCGSRRLTPIFAYDASIGDGSNGDGDARIDADASPMDLVAGDVPPTDVPIDGLPADFVCPNKPLVGFGAENGGTIGGGLGGRVVTANTLLELQGHANTMGPLIIQIGTIIEVTDQVRLQFDNVTIEGIAPHAGLHGGGLSLKDRINIIVRRLEFSEAVATDAITLDHSQRIWIDHCEFFGNLVDPKETFDDLVDITHASDFVTLSWNVFRDNYRVSLVGNMLTSQAEDTGHLRVTYHHNWFKNTPNNSPRVRFGTVHVLNNLYENIVDNAIASQMGALMLIEGNVFHNVARPILTTYLDPDIGYVNLRDDNTFDPASRAGLPADLATTPWIPAYTIRYDVDTTDYVSVVVPRCAGPGL